jgi:uncharacterized protein
MIIDLKNINNEEKVAITHQYDSRQEELEFDDFHYTQPILLNASVFLQINSLQVSGTLTSECVVACSRCLKEETIKINENFDLFFDVEGKQEIDITPEIREYLIFLHEQKYLCSPTCKGICLLCGEDQNIKECSCATNAKNQSEHSNKSFAKLKDMLNERKKEK